MRGCIEAIDVGMSRFIVDCGGKDRSFYLDCDIHELYRCGRYLGSKFNCLMEISE